MIEAKTRRHVRLISDNRVKINFTFMLMISVHNINKGSLIKDTSSD